jgi:hypothetical protein
MTTQELRKLAYNLNVTMNKMAQDGEVALNGLLGKIYQLEAELAALEAYKRQAEVSIAAQSRAWEQERNVSDELAKEVAQLRAEKVEREKQEPVAQLHPNHFKPNPDGTEWCREVLLYSPTNEGDKLRGVNTRVKLYRSAGAQPREPMSEAQALRLLQLCGILGNYETLEEIVRATESFHKIGAKE